MFPTYFSFKNAILFSLRFSSSSLYVKTLTLLQKTLSWVSLVLLPLTPQLHPPRPLTYSPFWLYFPQQVKLGSPDYTHCNTEQAVEDFMKRIKCYENSYQPLDEVLDRWQKGNTIFIVLQHYSTVYWVSYISSQPVVFSFFRARGKNASDAMQDLGVEQL